MNTYFRYYDERFGDVYEVYLNYDGSFDSACRTVEVFGRDPIYYNDLDEIPAVARAAIENVISERQRKKDD